MAPNDEPAGDPLVIPVVEEEVVAGARPVTTGGVRVEKHVDTRLRKVDIPLLHEEVEVKRVPVNRVVNEMPKPRQKGDVLIIPVVEEEVVVTKRLIVKEEIHVMKKRYKDRMVKEVEVDRERAVVQRLDEHGRVVEPAPKRRRGVLG